MSEQWSAEAAAETYSPWTVVHVVFQHLADQGLHPTLGEGGDPGGPAAELLRALGVAPAANGDARTRHETREHLAELRAALMDAALTDEG